MTKVCLPDQYGHSIKEINRDIKKYLQNHFLIDDKKGDILLQHYLKPIDNETKFKRHILIQPVDGTFFHSNTVRMFNKYDSILTPSSNCKRILEENDVYTPITVVPNYYDPTLINNYSNYFFSKFTEEKYTFYSETSGLPRKNVINIIKYYLETFTKKDNVRLVIKLSEDKYLEKIVSSFKVHDDSPELIIINEFVPIEDIMSLRMNIDCYICLSHMEGFCIPLLYAAVLKKDIISIDTKISGYSDFLDKSNAILLEPKMIEIFPDFDSVLIFSEYSVWEDVNYDEYKNALLDCYLNRYNFFKNKDYSDFHIENVMDQYITEVKVMERMI